MGYWRATGEFVTFQAKAVIVATGGVGKSWKFTSNSWEGTGDGHAMALWAGAKLIDMECIQFHPTGMVWPLSVRGLLVTESVRGDGGVLRNSLGERFMFNYVADDVPRRDGRLRRRGRQVVRRPQRRTTSAQNSCPATKSRAPSTPKSRPGAGSPHGGVFLDIASRRTPEFIRRRLPSMYHQFMELAGVDITREAMEIGPTCHYIMGGVQVDADTEETVVPGLFAAGEVAGGMHGANRLGGNSLSDLVVFGRRAGLGAAEYIAAGNAATSFNRDEVDAAIAEALAPLERTEGENPYTFSTSCKR